MALVTVTGNAWDHTGAPVPAVYRPELWFRPERADVIDDTLATPTEVKALMNAAGQFTVQLMSAPGVRYRPVLRWLVNPDEPLMEKWAYGYARWDWAVHPYPTGGPIGDIVDRPDLTAFSVLVALTLPPGYKGWWLNAGPGDPDNPAETGTGTLSIVS